MLELIGYQGGMFAFPKPEVASVFNLFFRGRHPVERSTTFSEQLHNVGRGSPGSWSFPCQFTVRIRGDREKPESQPIFLARIRDFRWR